MTDSGLHVLVAGGGLAGLASALFIARRGHRVTLVERDRQPPVGCPDEVFSAWSRPGVPQARQPHNFLGRSVRVLRQEAPDLLDALIAQGALVIPLELGEGTCDAMLCARRPLFESVVRRAVEAEPTIAVRAGEAITDLVIRPGETPIVTGVITDAGQMIVADLVVDAAGRRSPLPRLLQAHGTRPAVTTTQQCGLMYISRYYRLRPGCVYPQLDSPVIAALGWARSMAFPADNGTFALLATVAAIDPLRRQLITERGFETFHAAVPAIGAWAKAGEPISKTRAMARIANRYRRLADANGPIAGGMVIVGDSALHTNPTAGRGVSLAFAHAQHLAATIGQASQPIPYVAAFDNWTHANVGAWYAPQAHADTALANRMEAAVHGKPARPPEPDERLRLAIFQAARTSSEVSLPLRRMLHMVALPAEVLGSREVMAKLSNLLAARPELAAPADGPDRTQFAARPLPSLSAGQRHHHNR